jgi:hypothetical protein
MKPLCSLFALGAVAFGHQAGAEDSYARPFTAVDAEPRFMIYVQHSFGSSTRSVSPRLGFSVDRALPISLDRARIQSSVRLLDLQFATTAIDNVWLNGIKLSGEPDYTHRYDSYGGDSWDNPWLWFGLGGAALLGISCATENWPCEDDDDRGDSDSGYQIPNG